MLLNHKVRFLFITENGLFNSQRKIRTFLKENFLIIVGLWYNKKNNRQEAFYGQTHFSCRCE